MGQNPRVREVLSVAGGREARCAMPAPGGRRRGICIALPRRVRFPAGVFSVNRRAGLAWVLVVAWLGCILTASGDALSASQTSRFLRPFFEWLFPSLPEEQMWRLVAGTRKLAHVSEYFLLVLLAHRAWRLTALARGWELNSARLAGLAFAFAVTAASLDEFRQSFTRSRQGSVWDVLIDASGAALGLLCLWCFLNWRERRSRHPK
jgi:VanZ family protein